MNTQKRIIIIIILIILVNINYRMFFVHYENKQIELHSGYLDSKPKKITGGHSSFWLFSMKKKKFELNYINVDISDNEIKKIRTREKITLYSYNSFNLISLIDLINGRTTILGIKTKDINKNKSIDIFNNIKSMDEKAFYFLNPFLILALFAIYEEYKKKKNHPLTAP